MFFSVRIHYDNTGNFSCVAVGEVVENDLTYAQDLVVDNFKHKESDEVYIYKIQDNAIIPIIEEAYYDFRPKLF